MPQPLVAVETKYGSLRVELKEVLIQCDLADMPRCAAHVQWAIDVLEQKIVEVETPFVSKG